MTNRRFAVAYINFFDNEMKMSIVDAKNWKEALSLAYKKMYPNFSGEPGFDSLPDNLNEAHTAAFDLEFQFGVLEI